MEKKPVTDKEQQDKTFEGQRQINLIWEHTQSRIALFVIVCGMMVNAVVIIFCVMFIRNITVIQLALISLCLQFINYTCGIVTGFYFSRTNHAAIGSIGKKATDEQQYKGR